MAQAPTSSPLPLLKPQPIVNNPFDPAGTQAPPSMSQHDRINAWKGWLSTPMVQSALFQFGASMLARSQSGKGVFANIGESMGEAGDAVARTQEAERRQQLLEDKQAREDREEARADKRLTLEERRLEIMAKRGNGSGKAGGQKDTFGLTQKEALKLLADNEEALVESGADFSLSTTEQLDAYKFALWASKAAGGGGQLSWFRDFYADGKLNGFSDAEIRQAYQESVLGESKIESDTPPNSQQETPQMPQMPESPETPQTPQIPEARSGSVINRPKSGWMEEKLGFKG